MSMQGLLGQFVSALAAGSIKIVDLTQPLSADTLALVPA
jgi:hypothetical protein